MGKHKNIIEKIREQGVLPLFFHEDAKVCREVVQALYDAGIRIIEYTNRGETAIDNFKELVSLRDKQWPGLLLAIGTIKSLKDAKAAMKCHPDFIISPGINKEVGTKLNEEGFLWIPGCMTPSEIMLAEECGAKLVKLFPGNILGQGFMTAIKELFPNMEFMPTGGVELSKESIQSWFDAGVSAVGLGSKLISKELLDKRDYSTISQRATEALSIIQAIKK
jgi:2-dehydro-3-deoxyphosphogluconate aldolase/(4S)-4-hydroxy-2-oxoglutarate aldolase